MPPQPTNGSSEKAHGIGVHVTKVRMDATQAARGVAMQYPLRKVLLFCNNEIFIKCAEFTKILTNMPLVFLSFN
jgi:hypothetical protein